MVVRSPSPARKSPLLVAALMGSLLLGAPPAQADHFPDSDAESIAIVANQAPNLANYWWDHTDLTVAVRSAPNVDADRLAAVREAIAAWDAALRHEFGGQITLTDVTDDRRAVRNADIIVHYVPHYGGVTFAGSAHCSAGNSTSGCRNVIVASEWPAGRIPEGETGYTDAEVRTWAMHELGHALGIGHAEPISSTDLMGYGWPHAGDDGAPISSCDMDAVAAVFEWALEGTAPHRPTAAEVTCE